MNRINEIYLKCHAHWDAVPCQHKRILRMIRLGRYYSSMSHRKGAGTAIGELVKKGWIITNKNKSGRYIDTFQAVSEKQYHKSFNIIKLEINELISFDVSRTYSGFKSTEMLLVEIQRILKGLIFSMKYEFDLSLSDDFILTIKRIA